MRLADQVFKNVPLFDKGKLLRKGRTQSHRPNVSETRRQRDRRKHSGTEASPSFSDGLFQYVERTGTEMKLLKRGKKEKETETMIASMPRKPGPHTSEARILVVDDDTHVVETIRDLLGFKGFDVETAANGKQAIELLAVARHFDLLIVDVRMPEVGGLEVLRWVQKHRTQLPIIAITGYPTVDNGMKCVESGVVDYITKPFRFERLYNSVIECLANSPSNPICKQEQQIAQAI